MRQVLKYPGSKWNIARRLVELIPPHHSYVEPYFGSGAVLFNKPTSRIETVNELPGGAAMKQYCRYCCYLVIGDANYCSKQERTMSDSTAKSINRCSDFAYNPIDAFFENEKGYQPREPKKKQCDGQISLF